MDNEASNISRRNFMKRSVAGGAGLLVASDILSSELNAEAKKGGAATMMGVPFEPRERVRLGIIGVGGRGSSLLKDLLAVENVEIKPAFTTIEECWEAVNTSEATRKHCLILENCCYGATETMVLRMVQDGVFGQLTHAEGAYLHDLRSILTANESEGLWRRFPHMKRNGNLYPTHGLGPVAHYLDINRGDRFDYMVSVSSPEASLTGYVKTHFPEGDPKRSEKYICGDMNTSIIKTLKGRTILLQHDVVNPRPYSRLNSISGTKGAFADYPPRVFVDGQKQEEWDTIDAFREKYEHPLWKATGELAQKIGGHGGMDYVMNYRLMDCLKRGLPPDIDVYDAAAWSAPTPLSEASVAANGTPQKFPDFTRGHWNARTSSGFAEK